MARSRAYSRKKTNQMPTLMEILQKKSNKPSKFLKSKLMFLIKRKKRRRAALKSSGIRLKWVSQRYFLKRKIQSNFPRNMRSINKMKMSFLQIERGQAHLS